MKKTVTDTGLVRIEYHDQVWFEQPNTVRLFTRIHIEHSYERSPEGIFRENNKAPESSD